MTSRATGKSICSLESAAGPKPVDSQASPTIDLFGRPLAPAPHSPSPASRKHAQAAVARCLSRALDELASSYAPIAATHGTPIPGTYGRKHGASSPSSALQSSLESRLKASMADAGSPEYEVRWRYSDLPLPPRICALRASERRTPDSGFGGWPTPMAGTPAQKGYNEAGNNDSSRRTVALLAGWPTPVKGDAERGSDTYAHRQGNPTLVGAARLAGWATPRESDGAKNVRTTEGALKEAARKGANNDLGVTSQLAGWPTASARDWKGGKSNQHGKNARPLNEMAELASGPPSTSSPAEMENRGALSPEHSRWIMGFPPEWASCAPTAMPSSRKSRRSS